MEHKLGLQSLWCAGHFARSIISSFSSGSAVPHAFSTVSSAAIDWSTLVVGSVSSVLFGLDEKNFVSAKESVTDENCDSTGRTTRCVVRGGATRVSSLCRDLQSSSSSKISTTVAALELDLLPPRAVADPLTEAVGCVGAMELDVAGREYCEPRVLTFGTPGDHALGVVGDVGEGEIPDRIETGGFAQAPRGVPAPFFAGGPFPLVLLPAAQAAEPTEWQPSCERLKKSRPSVEGRTNWFDRHLCGFREILHWKRPKPTIVGFVKLWYRAPRGWGIWFVTNIDDILFDEIVCDVLDFPTIFLCGAMVGVLGVKYPRVTMKISFRDKSRTEHLRPFVLSEDPPPVPYFPANIYQYNIWRLR